MKSLLLLLSFLLFTVPLQAQWLQEDTATSVTLWIFNTADSTPKTGLDVTTITVRYVKSDGTTASFSPTASAGSNDMVEKGHGAYFQELTAAQLDTIGPFDIGCSVSGGVCAATVYQILPAASYSMLAGGNVATGSDLWNVATVDVTAGIGLQLKTNLDQKVSVAGGIITSGIAQAGAANTITLEAGAPAITLVNKRILLTGGTGVFQSGIVTAYDTGTKVATVQDSATGGNWTQNPAVGTAYVIFDASLGALVDNIITAAKIAADSLGDSEIQTGAIAATAFAAGAIDAAAVASSAIGADEIAAGAITASEISDGAIDAATFAAGAIDAAAISTDAIGAAEIAASAIGATEAPNLDAAISTRASQTSLDTVDDFLDTEIAAIKTKTDFLPSATAGAAGGVFIAGTNAATTVTTAFTTTFTGNLTGSVASVTGAVGSVTGNVDGNVNVGSMTAAALADFFDTNSGTTYGAAVAGSVVKEMADNAAPGASDALATGTADSGSTTTMVDAARTEADNDYWKGRIVCFTSGNISGQCALIEDFVASSDTFTLKPALTQAVGTQNYKIFAHASEWDATMTEHLVAGTTGEKLNAAASAGDPWTTALPGAYTTGQAGYILGTNLNAQVSGRASQTSVDDVQSDTNDIQTRLPAALVSGRMDASVGAMASSVLTAAAINADAFTAAKFAADVSTEFAATLMATTFEGSNTFKHFLQYGASALFGKYNSAAGTFNFRDLADSKNRIVYTTSSTARTSVTLSPD